MVDPMHSDPGSVVGEAEHTTMAAGACSHLSTASADAARVAYRTHRPASGCSLTLMRDRRGSRHRGCTTSSPSDPRTDSINDEEVELPGGCTPETGLPSSSGVFFLLPSRRFS